MAWIFEDKKTVSIADRDLLVDYLSTHRIESQGYFQEALEGEAWRYPAFAVKRFPTHPRLEKKLRLLCQRRGSSENDVERHYQNQMSEFHALYALVDLMGYQFEEWDVPSEKPTADPEKDCDLALSMNGNTVFADSKDCSSEVLSQYGRGEEKILDETVSTAHYTPKVELVRSLKRLIQENLNKKGADLLVYHPPERVLSEFDGGSLKRYLETILPNVLTWTEKGPTWPIASGSVKQIIVIKHGGCSAIELDATSVLSSFPTVHFHKRSSLNCSHIFQSSGKT